MKTRIFLHPSLGQGEPHYLDQRGTLDDITRTGLIMQNGMQVTFYDYDASDKSDEDNLLFEGVVQYDDSSKRWFALIDPMSFRHESDEAQEGD